jgi:hypothetical protein
MAANVQLFEDKKQVEKEIYGRVKGITAMIAQS